jgi:hypothetical protein
MNTKSSAGANVSSSREWQNHKYQTGGEPADVTRIT